MLQYIQVLALIVLEFVVFFLFGKCALKLIHSEDKSTVYTVVIGSFFQFFLFMLVAIPMKYLLCPLNWLSIAWSIMVLAVALIVFIFDSAKIKNELQMKYKEIKADKWVIVLMVGMVLFQFAIILTNGMIGSPWDDAYYIGDVATSVYTNTIGQYDPYSGEKLATLNKEYFWEILENYSAVICQIFHMHPLIETKLFLVEVVVFVYNFIVYLIGMLFTKNSRVKTCLFMFFSTLLLIYSTSTLSTAYFYFFRGAEGKTFQAVIIIPFFLYQFWRIVQNSERKSEWKALFIVVVSCFGINMSSLFLMPTMMSACLLTLAIAKRDKKIIRHWLICMIPCIIIAVTYIAMKNDIILLTIK